MFEFAGFKNKLTGANRQRTVNRLVKPGLRGRVDAGTIGFAASEPVKAVLGDGTLVLYDGAVLKPDTDPLQELKPQAGYRIWERMTDRV